MELMEPKAIYCRAIFRAADQLPEGILRKAAADQLLEDSLRKTAQDYARDIAGLYAQMGQAEALSGQALVAWWREWFDRVNRASRELFNYPDWKTLLGELGYRQQLKLLNDKEIAISAALDGLDRGLRAQHQTDNQVAKIFNTVLIDANLKYLAGRLKADAKNMAEPARRYFASMQTAYVHYIS